MNPNLQNSIYNLVADIVEFNPKNTWDYHLKELNYHMEELKKLSGGDIDKIEEEWLLKKLSGEL